MPWPFAKLLATKVVRRLNPYLDLPGFTQRSVMPASDIAIVEAAAPGFTKTRLTLWQSKINARLRKRYGNALPMGQSPPALVAAGTSPPGVSLGGRPILGSTTYIVQITTGGALGAAIFSYSLDGGQTFTGGGFTVGAPTGVPLGQSGVAAVFSPGTYATDNVYASGPAVPDVVLEWLTALVTVDLYRKRGVNPQDPAILMVREDADRALAELKEAADSQDGLLDIAVSDDGVSGVNTGGPLGFNEQSPYVWTNKQRRDGEAEDAANTLDQGGNSPLVT